MNVADTINDFLDSGFKFASYFEEQSKSFAADATMARIKALHREQIAISLRDTLINRLQDPNARGVSTIFVGNQEVEIDEVIHVNA